MVLKRRRRQHEKREAPAVIPGCTATVSRISTISAFLFLPLVALADALPDHDNGPITGLFGFPESTESGAIVARGEHKWGAYVSASSHSIDENVGNETLTIDGETTRIAFDYRLGLSDRLDIGFEIPYMWHQSGSFDSAIDRWHKIFGLPDGARDTRERDQIEFLYAVPTGNGVALSNNARGVGDIRLLAGWQLSKSKTQLWALQFGVKLPTGDSAALLGSGGTDVSIGISGDTMGLWGNANLSGLYRANVTYIGEPDNLTDLYNNIVGQLAFGIAYQLNQKVDLRLQSRIRSAVYDSAIENLGDPSVSLTFGAEFSVADDYRLSISVGEDLLPGSAPDVSFQIAVRSASSR